MDELAFVESERDHFAQVARDTFQELKAVTAERDHCLAQLQAALERVEQLTNATKEAL